MFEHVTVLRKEAVDGLNIIPEGTYVDCTLGGAGHSRLIVSRLGKEGHLIGLDRDEQALRYARQQLGQAQPQVTLIKSNFRNIDQVLKKNHIDQVNGFLFDLGVSSPQLDQVERGFSYQHDAPLDMRMDRDQSVTAQEVVNEWTEQQLIDIIFRYGEERFARRIARFIVREREQAPLCTTFQLVDVIKRSIPAKARRSGPHPAKRTFQAIRIAVNDELRAFEETLLKLPPLLKEQGRICVITFHSLEDRLCKQFFKQESQGCTCPPDFPQCVCGQQPQIKIITRKPLLPKREETADNPRARSAKLRIAEKI